MKFTVPAEYDGISVKQFLRKHCLVSARTLAKLKRTENGMTVNGKTVRSIDMLNGGEEIILTFPEDDIPSRFTRSARRSCRCTSSGPSSPPSRSS